jgi:CheY-like chemotaxis protein
MRRPLRLRLVVDDEPDARELVGVVVRKQGAEVVEAAEAAEASDLPAARRFDVLLSDVGMPGEDGLSLIRRVRRMPSDTGGGIPAAALTAFAREADRIRVLEAGFQMHIAKPVAPTALAAAVARLAGRPAPEAA